MPRRITPLVNGEIYHVFNKGIASENTFTSTREYQRAKITLKFYQYYPLYTRLSLFLQLDEDKRKNLFKFRGAVKIVSILAYVFMPNHFHFLVRQEEEGGISRFMSNFQNSYTRYFNTIHKRVGGLFLTQFKAVKIDTDEQLYHVSRYIHLNPYAAEIIRSLEELRRYRWSSLPEYLGLSEEAICDKELILSNFGSVEKYQEFVFDQADYQRSLEKIKRLSLE